MKDAKTRRLTEPGDFEQAQRDKGRHDCFYPSTLVLGVYRRSTDRSPCIAYLRCWPDGTTELREHDSSTAALQSMEQAGVA